MNKGKLDFVLGIVQLVSFGGGAILDLVFGSEIGFDLVVLSIGIGLRPAIINIARWFKR